MWNLYIYRNYITNYFYHISYELKESDSTKNNLTVNMLNAIVENIKIEEFKNSLLKKTVVDEFLKRQTTCSINEETYKVFLENCTDNSFKEEIQNLVNDSEYVKNHMPLENFVIKSYDDRVLSVSNVIEDRKSVIYFWSFLLSDQNFCLQVPQLLECS